MCVFVCVRASEEEGKIFKMLITTLTEHLSTTEYVTKRVSLCVSPGPCTIQT